MCGNDDEDSNGTFYEVVVLKHQLFPAVLGPEVHLQHAEDHECDSGTLQQGILGARVLFGKALLQHNGDNIHHIHILLRHARALPDHTLFHHCELLDRQVTP